MQPECAKIRAPITGPAGAVALGSTFYSSVLVVPGLRTPPVIQKEARSFRSGLLVLYLGCAQSIFL